MDHPPRHRYRNGFDWHKVVFWSSLSVAVVLMVFQGLSRDGRIITVFTPEGRDLFRRILSHISPF